MKVDFTQTVMARIENEHIQMRPKHYFVLRSVLLKLGITLLAATALYLINLTIFKFRIYNPFGYLWFGTSGLQSFAGSVPWAIMTTALLLMIGTVFTLHKSTWADRANLGSLALGVLLLFLAGGVAVDKTGINDSVRASKKVPLLYSGTFSSEYWVMGRVIQLDLAVQKMTVYTPNNETVEVIWNNQTLLPSGTKFKVGDTVQVIGKKEPEDSLFAATGINIR